VLETERVLIDGAHYSQERRRGANDGAKTLVIRFDVESLVLFALDVHTQWVIHHSGIVWDSTGAIKSELATYAAGSVAAFDWILGCP
jgi:hypothetical protein